MGRSNLILDRYEPMGTAGSGGFGTVQIAWDPRIQRKVAIKTIKLTERDAYRAALPGAQAVAQPAGEAGSPGGSEPRASDGAGAGPGGSAESRWRGVLPWEEYLEQGEDDESPSQWAVPGRSDDGPPDEYHALAHLPGLDEARTAAMLADPRIVTVYDFEVRERTAYLIMEYVEGITLTKLMREYTDYLTLDVVAAVFDSVAGALEVAHDNSVLHLDIKPDNILINAKGEVKVTDFGLATLADASGRGTTGGGTIGYMPLEQMRREKLDARTDEWSLAAVTYEMLTGENPFLAHDLEEAELAIEDAELVLPSLCWERIDEQIDDVIFYALDPDRDERYASVRDFAEEVDKFLGDARKGREQLAEVVAEEMREPEPEPVEPEGAAGAIGRKRGSGRFSWVLSLLDRGPAPAGEPASGKAVRFDDEPDWEDAADGLEDDGRSGADGADRQAHVPLRDRADDRTRSVLAAICAVAGCAFVAALGAWNLVPLEVFGAGRTAVAVAVVVAAAALAVVRPSVGTLVSFIVLALALVTNGAILSAIVLLVALAAWWYFIGREGMAATNVALVAPALGSVGGAVAVPLLAGATLRPLQAMATAAFAFVCTLVLASLGSESLLGWDILSHWSFAGANVDEVFVRMLTRPTTWIVLAGWVCASAAQSALSVGGRRWMEVAGIACGVVLLALANIALVAPSAQLIVPLVLAAAVLVAVLA